MSDDDPAPRTEVAPFLPDYLLFLLATASAAGRAEFHAMARARGLRVPEWRVLACLHDLGRASVSELARLALLEQSRLTHLITRIEARGLVKRHRGTKNRRSVLVTLTEDGAALAADLVAQARTHEQSAVIDQLGQADTAKLHALLRKLIGHPPV